MPITGDADKDNAQAIAFFAAVSASVMLGLGFLLFDFLEGKSLDKIILSNKINPNNAESVSLQRLVGIGAGKAEAIIQYREQKMQNGEQRAFGCSDDLDEVEGIGVKTINNISNWLTFEN